VPEIVTLLLADDHEVIRAGIQNILRARPGWRIVAAVPTGAEALDAARLMVPDVALVSTSMMESDGFHTAAEIARLGLGTRTILLSTHDGAELKAKAKQAGARGCLTKSSAASDLVAAVEAVMAGQTFFGEAGPA
jgi:DNA-binding NarL/FixJ family response regulator